MKLNLYVATFSYGGNGGISSTFPATQSWVERTIAQARNDARIGGVNYQDYVDTPITMTRNRAVLDARKSGAHMLLMVDSDMYPDYELRMSGAGKPFWPTSFDFLYRHYEKGPVCVAAPYCGPPPCEVVYVFKWADEESDAPTSPFALIKYGREEAAIRTGIEPVAAAPTGLILFDLRCFDIVPCVDRVSLVVDELAERATLPLTDRGELRSLLHAAAALSAQYGGGWFYYEMDAYGAEKMSTEDVTCTRDISLIGCRKLGYNPVHINWDAWAGHVKQKIVGKPKLIDAERVSRKLADAVSPTLSVMPKSFKWEQQSTL